MKGVDSHGCCKNYCENRITASAYMPDNDTTGGYVLHMAVGTTVFHILSGIICITAVLGYGFGQETGTEAVRMLVAGFILYILPVLSGWTVMWLETIKIRLMGD